MCYSQIQVRCRTEEEQKNLAEKLLLFLSSDIVELDRDFAHVASANEFDLYFMARDDLMADKAQLSFWFPYPVKNVVMGTNDLPRKNRYVRWQMQYLSLTLDNPNPSQARSFGWDEKLIQSYLSTMPGHDVDTKIRRQLAKLRGTNFPSSLTITLEEQKPIRDEGGNDQGRHFVATLDGELKKGDFFHIYFAFEKAEAQKLGQPCSGAADLYFYDNKLNVQYPYHPFAQCPAIPCLFIHFAVFFPTPLKSFKPTNYEKFLFPGANSPTGLKFEDGRWFVICNALKRPSKEYFESYSSWIVSRCEGNENKIHEGSLSRRIKPAIDQLAESEDVQEIAISQINLLASFYTLTLEQSKRSFIVALIAAVIGLAFFLAAVSFILVNDRMSAAIISLISGGLVQVIAAIIFYLYDKTSVQLADFRARLDTTQRYLLANSVIEDLSEELKDQARFQLVQVIIGILPSSPTVLDSGGHGEENYTHTQEMSQNIHSNGSQTKRVAASVR